MPISPAHRFGGAFDLRAAVEAVERGRVLHPMQLNGVASTLAVRRQTLGFRAPDAAHGWFIPMKGSFEMQRRGSHASR